MYIGRRHLDLIKSRSYHKTSNDNFYGDDNPLRILFDALQKPLPTIFNLFAIFSRWDRVALLEIVTGVTFWIQEDGDIDDDNNENE